MAALPSLLHHGVPLPWTRYPHRTFPSKLETLCPQPLNTSDCFSRHLPKDKDMFLHNNIRKLATDHTVLSNPQSTSLRTECVCPHHPPNSHGTAGGGPLGGGWVR